MRVAIWGAGGIGCYYGARLLKAGHQVVFVARGAHLEAMQSSGLIVEHEALSFSGAVDAVSQSEWVEHYRCDDFDLIMVALKANVTGDCLAEIDSWLQQGSCPLLSLQNGVENESLIADRVGDARTLGGLAVRIGGHIIEPGRVEARGPAQVVMGAWPNRELNPELSVRAESLAEILNEAQIPTQCSVDIRRELWRKLLINNGVNPLSALTELDTRRLTRHPTYRKMVYKMMEEGAAAANARGVDLGRADVDEMFKLISEFDAIKTSMLVDKEKGRPLELDGICGAVIRAGATPEPLVTELVMSLLADRV